jgi:hypothetical protein
MHIPRDLRASDFETSPILGFGEVSNALIQRLSAPPQQEEADGTEPAINSSTLARIIHRRRAEGLAGVV